MKLTFEPTPKQDEGWEYLTDDVTEEFLFGGGAGGGKSWLGSEWLTYLGLQYPETRYFIARKTLKNLKKTTLRTFFKTARHHNLKDGPHWTYSDQKSLITFTQTDATIDLLEVSYQPSDPDYEDLGSAEYTSGWSEEAGEINFGAFDTLNTRIGRHLNDEYGLLGKHFVTCNPKKNWMYKWFYLPWKRGTLPPERAFLQSLIDDNPRNEKGYKQKLLRIKNPNKKQRLLYGNWEYDDDPSTLMEYEYITDIFSNTVEESEEKFMTVDVARFGEDKTVIMLWEGMRVYKIIVREKQGTDVTKDLIKETAREEHIPFSHIVIDEDGVGGGIVDALRGVKGFVNNSSPMEDKRLDEKSDDKPNYRNLKSQCYYMLSEEVNEHNIAIDVTTVDWDSDEDVVELITEELEHVKERNVDDDSKKLEVLPKEEVKETLGRSPDFSDCMMMRMFFFLGDNLKKKKQVKTYRPKLDETKHTQSKVYGGEKLHVAKDKDRLEKKEKKQEHKPRPMREIEIID